jgi:SNF2 family DNA or RNA helicase
MDVQASAFSPDRLRGRIAAEHLVTLSSLEDDALGEELQVLWNLEPSRATREGSGLPSLSGFDAPDVLDGFLDAVRWGAVSSADVSALQAPFRSGIQIEDYQLDPVARALSMPRVNLLIADDVGLGKTIETGLVVQELLLRHRARTVLVVCPSSLQRQWQEQMRDKFGLRFEMIDSEALKQLRRRRGLHVNPWAHFPRLITSIDFIKRERPLGLFRQLLPPDGQPGWPRKFDILIIDEAHNVAPSGRGQYATDSLRTRAIRTLAPHFEHKLFLSATPHNGYRESFTALLELLDSQRFSRGVDADPKQLQSIMVRRLKRELPPRWDGKARFPQRLIEPLEINYPDSERELHQLLKDYSARRLAAELSPAARLGTEFVLKLLKKRLFSSPAAFLATLQQHRATLTRAKPRARALPTASVLRARIDGLGEDFADDDALEEAELSLTDTASRLFDAPSAEELALLDRLIALAEEVSRRPDAKAARLIEWLETRLRPGGDWSDERVILFTEYRATQSWLHTLLAARGLTANERLMLLYGGMDSDQRERIKAAFQADPGASAVRILLATDAASEGVDLQNHCANLIHYEIPWNPNRMEQRNGRIDRHGQRAEQVNLFHFVGRGFRRTDSAQAASDPGSLEADHEFLMRAVLKVEQIREDLGKVGPVIAEQVEEAMLGRRRQLDTRVAEDQAQAVRKRLTFERNLREQLGKLHEKLLESRRTLHLAPENIERAVRLGLQLAGQPALIDAEVPGIWPDPSGQRAACPCFHLPRLTGSWAHCTEGLAHPHTQAIRPIVFDHALAQGRDDIVLAHLNHRLVQMCLHLLRAELWASETRHRLHRVTARLLPDAALDTPAVIAHGRILVLGGDSQRLHEEIIAAGGQIKDGRLRRFTTVSEVQRLLDAALPMAAGEAVKARFQALWPSLREGLLAALERRASDRTKNLQSFLDERMARDINEINSVLSQLEQQIAAELARDDQPIQLSLWAEPEIEQRERDLANLRARLAAIPEEREKEAANIQRRYAAPEPRLFPVAVTFLVPNRLNA